jgi:hypothetical protein
MVPAVRGTKDRGHSAGRNVRLRNSDSTPLRNPIIFLYLSLILCEGRKSKGDFWGIQIESLVNCTWF